MSIVITEYSMADHSNCNFVPGQKIISSQNCPNGNIVVNIKGVVAG